MTATAAPTKTTPRTTPRTAAARCATAPCTWLTLTERVRNAGGYRTAAEAEHRTRVVLSALGSQVTGEERVSLAHALPEEAAGLIAAQIPALHPLPARDFVESVASRLDNATTATARWDTSTVLTVLADLLPPPLLTNVLTQLPRGYALLFGRAELSADRPLAHRTG
ncbi:DUF2267 domain-containing protein [Streptomyces sp. NPDC057197]|uniref:DUF2267 domain-containing protein n=1 Tax=Streptomyces sp. NPDC057197 TaxID=3346045 RepID=UPI0036254A20